MLKIVDQVLAQGRPYAVLLSEVIADVPGGDLQGKTALKWNRNLRPLWAVRGIE